VEVARPVVAHFSALGETFPEVVVYAYGSRADLVCRRRDGSLDVVEVKRGPCARLLRQVQCWERSADRIWAAYQAPRRGAAGARWADKFRSAGVGVLEVGDDRRVFVRAEPADRAPDPYWRRRLADALSPLHRDFAEAGNAESRYLSAFRVTCANLLDMVRANPGITMKTAVACISHHYTSEKVARSSLLAWIRAKKVPGVVTRPLEGSRHALGLYPEASNPHSVS
jgi:hypothetical protein